jgi:lysyl-tRNA synthetase class 2
MIKRAELVAQIRNYFASQCVLEVETPTLAPSTITDLNLEALCTLHTNPHSVEKTHLFLQTSPEYFMKRMLSAGFPSIYQITKCYRDDEVGRYHNPEFTMLEWYRLGFSMDELIDDVDNVLRLVLNTGPCEKVTYSSLFREHLSFDVKADTDSHLVSICKMHGFNNLIPLDFNGKLSSSARDSLLQVLFCEKIENNIGIDRPVVVTHFPASQASLAKFDAEAPWLALRFEFYYRGIELANGFEELTNAEEQKRRFLSDNEAREINGLKQKPLDLKFLRCLESGLPECSGVALGVDRLLMLALDKEHIADVLSFDFSSL